MEPDPWSPDFSSGSKNSGEGPRWNQNSVTTLEFWDSGKKAVPKRIMEFLRCCHRSRLCSR